MIEPTEAPPVLECTVCGRLSPVGGAVVRVQLLIIEPSPAAALLMACPEARDEIMHTICPFCAVRLFALLSGGGAYDPLPDLTPERN